MAPETTTPVTEDPIVLEPTEAELQEWAERERKRREAWLQGPSAEERAAYIRAERDRRAAEAQDQEARIAERLRQMRIYPREAQLAAEGAMSLLVKWSRQGFAELVRAGRAWEEEVAEPRRRRVPIDDSPAGDDRPDTDPPRRIPVD